MDNTTILIVLVIALAVIVILYVYRNKLHRFSMTANKEGVRAELETTKPNEHPPDFSEGKEPNSAGITIKGNTQYGTGNRISVGQNDVEVTDNLQDGDNQTIEVNPRD